MSSEKIFRYIRIYSENLNMLTVVEESAYPEALDSIMSTARVLCKNDPNARIDAGFIESGLERDVTGAEADFNNGYFYSEFYSLIN